MEGTPTVFVVDDDRSFCRAVERLLHGSGHRVEWYDSPTEFVDRWRPDQPGCLILDLFMPDLPGLEVQRRIATDERSPPIIFVSGHADVRSCVRAMRGGAADILLKPFDEDELLAAVDKALAADAAWRRGRDELQEMQARLASLTPRELEVFRLVVKGLLNKQIAAVLGAKVGTIKMHRGHLMRKLRLGSIAELVSFSDRLSLADPCPALHARAGRFGPTPAGGEPAECAPLGAET